MKELNFKEVQLVSERLQALDPNSLASSPQMCYEISVWCATQRAYTGEAMALAKKQWMDRKKKAYETFVMSNEANQTKVDRYGVMAVKDYIASCCGDYEARYEYCERLNAALDSMIRTLVTIISSLKEEQKNYGFQHD